MATIDITPADGFAIHDGPLVAGEPVAVTATGFAATAETLTLVARSLSPVCTIATATLAFTSGAWTGTLDTASRQTAIMFATATADGLRPVVLELIDTETRDSLAVFAARMRNSALIPSANPCDVRPIYIPVPGPPGEPGEPRTPYDSDPAMDGTASPGVSDDFARGDHVHPTDMSRVAQTALAAAFTAQAYAIGNLVTYNGLLYRCKANYTATSESQKPDADTTHWEGCVVAVLLGERVAKSGDTMTGRLTANGFVSTTSGNSFVITPEDTPWQHTTLEHPGILTVTTGEDGAGTTSVVFLPGTPAAASNPSLTVSRKGDLPTTPAGVGISTETWTFTVDDGQGGTTTVTKSVCVVAAQQQGA